MEVGQSASIHFGGTWQAARLEVIRHGRYSFTGESETDLELPLPETEVLIHGLLSAEPFPARVDRCARIGQVFHLVVTPLVPVA